MADTHNRPEVPTILGIHAHPDDLEILCGGTLALLSRTNCKLVLATMTGGDCGSQELSREEIAQVRKQEAANAAEKIGADYHCLEFLDLGIFNNDESRKRVTELIRRVKPNVVITSSPEDYHCDHEATSRLVEDACFSSVVPNYKTDQWDPADVLEELPWLYFADPIGGTDHLGREIPPAFAINISEVMDEKLDMLACHVSQREWLRAIHGMDDYLNSTRDFVAKTGAKFGVEYAEGYRQRIGHPYPSDGYLQDLLSSALLKQS